MNEDLAERIALPKFDPQMTKVHVHIYWHLHLLWRSIKLLKYSRVKDSTVYSHKGALTLRARIRTNEEYQDLSQSALQQYMFLQAIPNERAARSVSTINSELDMLVHVQCLLQGNASTKRGAERSTLIYQTSWMAEFAKESAPLRDRDNIACKKVLSKV
eukprot:5046041-Amphidinium_carterae.5